MIILVVPPPNSSSTTSKGATAMTLPVDVVTSVAATSFKTLAESAAFAMGLAYQDSVDSQRNGRTVANSAMAAAVKALVEPNIEESVSVSKMATGNDMAAQIMQLVAAISSSSQQAKIVYATPPAHVPAKA